MPHNLLPLRAGELGARTASVSSRETSSRTSTKDDEAEASARGEDDAGTAGDDSDDTLGTDKAGEATSEHGFANLADMALARDTVYIEFRNASAASGFGTGYRGKAFIESLEASGGVDDFATYSVTFKGDGDLETFTT